MELIILLQWVKKILISKKLGDIKKVPEMFYLQKMEDL